jgi:DNA-binding LacI/PurR family transcriptional regulator
MAATIKDIARKAGVSITIVSRTLNGEDGVGAGDPGKNSSPCPAPELHPQPVLLNRVSGKKPAYRHRILSVELVIRDSTAPPPEKRREI